LPAFVYDMMTSQRPPASTPLRMARKIWPSDQWRNCPAGVRLEDMNVPIGAGKSLPTSNPPVSVPFGEWQPAQKLLAMASPWRICCGVLAAIKSGAGALRTCIFERPASISTPAKQTAEADITTSGVTAHFTSLLRMPRANTRQK
jgi:hypothetical protein